MAGINIHNTNIQGGLPSDASVRRLKGTWYENGFEAGFNRPERFECVVLNGCIHEVDYRGYVDLDAPLPVRDGEIEVRGTQVTFMPSKGELARVGVAEG